MVAGDSNSVPPAHRVSIITHWAISPGPHSLSSLPLWLYHIPLLPNTFPSCYPHKFILLTDHNLLSCPPPWSSFQLMTVIHKAAVKVFANIFLLLNYFSRIYSPKWDNIPPSPLPRARGGTNMKKALSHWATHWGILGRPSNPQPLGGFCVGWV